MCESGDEAIRSTYCLKEKGGMRGIDSSLSASLLYFPPTVDTERLVNIQGKANIRDERGGTVVFRP